MQKTIETYTEYWEKLRSEAHAVLEKNIIITLPELITLIKKVNPTPHVHLSFEEKDEAYRLKTELQNLLLLHYGDLFVLEPSRWDNDTVLLRYRIQPMVDACHAKVHKLSAKALDVVCMAIEPKKEKKKSRINKQKVNNNESSDSLNSLIKRAEELARNYDYENTLATLSNLFINETDDIPVFLKGLNILLEDICAYDKALEILLALPEKVKKDVRIRAALANIYWLKGCFIDARGLFEECNLKELNKNSIYRYAYILHNEKEISEALELINYAETLLGYEAGLEDLKKEVTKYLKEEASSFYEGAKKEFEKNNFEQSEILAKQAIRIYAEYSEARELLRLLREFNSEENITALWNQFNSSDDSEKRIGILKRIQSVDNRTRELVAEFLEKEVRKEEEKQTSKLRLKIVSYLESQNYKDGFDAIYHLSKNQRAIIESIIDKYPILNSLIRNERLWRLKIVEARECWLAYIEAIEKFSTENENNIDRILNLLKKASRAFSENKDFIKLHDGCKNVLVKRSRQRIKSLLFELRSKDESFSLNEDLARKIYVEARNLPEAEADEFREKVEYILNRSSFIQTASYHARCFRKSLLSGDIEGAEKHSNEINDKIIIQKISKEISEIFKIEARTLNVDFSGHNLTTNDAISKDFIFLNALEDEVFFQYKRADGNCLIRLSFEKSTAVEYLIPKLNLSFLKVVDKDDAKKTYSFLCMDNASEYYCVEVLFDTEYKVLKYINLSDLLGLDSKYAPVVYTFFYLSNNSRYLYISYKHSEDDWDYRLLSCIDLKRDSVIKTAKMECFLDTLPLLKLPTEPSCILAGENNGLRKYNDKFKIITDIVIENDGYPKFEKLEINQEKKRIYCFMWGVNDLNTNPDIMLPCFFNMVVLDWDLTILNDFYTDLHTIVFDKSYIHDIHYDSVSNFLYLVSAGENGIVYDCTFKKILKELAPGDYIFRNKTKVLYLFGYNSDNNTISLRKQ